MKKMMLILAILLPMLALPVIADNITVTADVPTYVSVVFNYNTVSFGAVQPGSTDVPAPGQANGIYNVTVKSNLELNVIAYRSAWSPYDGLTLKFGVAVDSLFLDPKFITTKILTTDPQVVGGISATDGTHYHGYWLTVPTTQAPGSYSTTVTITYQPA